MKTGQYIYLQSFIECNISSNKSNFLVLGYTLITLFSQFISILCPVAHLYKFAHISLGTYGLKTLFCVYPIFFTHDPTLFTQSWIVRIVAYSMSGQKQAGLHHHTNPSKPYKDGNLIGGLQISGLWFSRLFAILQQSTTHLVTVLKE